MMQTEGLNNLPSWVIPGLNIAIVVQLIELRIKVGIMWKEFSRRKKLNGDGD